MSSAPGTVSPKLTTEAMRQYVDALPALGDLILLDERATQAARSVLERADPTWEQRLKTQIESIMRGLAADLDYDSRSGRYAITGAELRGIIARAVSQASGQVAVDVGRQLSEASLATQFTTQQTSENTPATSYRRTGLQQEF